MVLEALLAQAGSRKSPARNEVRSVDDALHGAISEAAGNPQMAAILLALEAADGAEAANAMRTHLDCVRQSIIDRLARI
jgi:DNA-binding GntR family transcriptional regulator